MQPYINGLLQKAASDSHQKIALTKCVEFRHRSSVYVFEGLKTMRNSQVGYRRLENISLLCY